MAALAPIDPDLGISRVRLAVSDLDRSLAFYSEVLGLEPGKRSSDRSLLGVQRQRPALELRAIGRATLAAPHSTGLFHVAWLHPSRAALAETLARVAQRGWRIDGAADHGVSEALYLSDPDGLGIEIYADRPRERWEPGERGEGVRMVTLPLDLDDLLAQGSGEEGSEIAAGTVIGHVHLKVADVPRARDFYRDVLGFSERATMPSAAFLAADGYHHHVGLNSWQSRGASAATQSAPGLRLIEFSLSDQAALGALERRLEREPAQPYELEDERRLSLHDPDGNRLAFAEQRALAAA